jgi:hypothetical protein
MARSSRHELSASQLPTSKDLNTETKEPQWLAAVTKQRPVKTITDRDAGCGIMICKV